MSVPGFVRGPTLPGCPHGPQYGSTGPEQVAVAVATRGVLDKQDTSASSGSRRTKGSKKRTKGRAGKTSRPRKTGKKTRRFARVPPPAARSPAARSPAATASAVDLASVLAALSLAAPKGKSKRKRKARVKSPSDELAKALSRMKLRQSRG